MVPEPPRPFTKAPLRLQTRPPVDEAARRGGILRTLFDPELPASLDDLRQTHGLFVPLVADIFLHSGIIKADCPELRDPARLKLRALLARAWRGLAFSRHGLPGVLLFGAVVGSLVIALLAMLLLAGSIIFSL